MEEKRTSEWGIATIYYLVAGFVIPTTVSTIYVFAAISIGVTPDNSISFLVQDIFVVAAIVLGTKYFAGYIREAYSIDAVEKVINIATAYFVIVEILFLILLAFSTTNFTFIILVIDFGGVILRVTTFYFASRSFLT
jgi:hypothetical protein